MATSIVLALTTAAITACGGGSTDTSSSTTESASATVGSAADAASSATGEITVTTNTSAVAATSGDATTVASSTSAGTSTTETATDTSTTTVAADTAAAAADAQALAAHSGASTSTGPNSTVYTSTSPPPVPRPAGNTGTGFYVAGGKLYDAKGKEFRIRGINRTHWDSYGSPTGVPLSGANTERIALNYTRATSDNMSIITTQMLNNKIVPMLGNWSATCKADPASLSAIVDIWVAQASTWTKLNSNGLINIANEWGPSSSTIWRDNYITAIARMRAAGYTGTLVVDAGGCGQSAGDILNYGAAVLAADPQKNILFDVHVYGNFFLPATASWQQDYSTAMTKLKATGLPIILGEFGPGKSIGPSPTLITPQQVIATAEAAGWGWMPWAWDDNNLAACTSNDAGFSMTVKCGAYKTSADLTLFGQTIVPIMQSTAIKASIF